VGIQRRRKELLLLLFDPGKKSNQLAQSLRHGRGWQGLVKRKIGNLPGRQREYHVVYLDGDLTPADVIKRRSHFSADIQLGRF
jgi:hypothetical protein